MLQTMGVPESGSESGSAGFSTIRQHPVPPDFPLSGKPETGIIRIPEGAGSGNGSPDPVPK
jgi:hypothetical protein